MKEQIKIIIEHCNIRENTRAENVDKFKDRIKVDSKILGNIPKNPEDKIFEDKLKNENKEVKEVKEVDSSR